MIPPLVALVPVGANGAGDRQAQVDVGAVRLEKMLQSSDFGERSALARQTDAAFDL